MPPPRWPEARGRSAAAVQDERYPQGHQHDPAGHQAADQHAYQQYGDDQGYPYGHQPQWPADTNGAQHQPHYQDPHAPYYPTDPGGYDPGQRRADFAPHGYAPGGSPAGGAHAHPGPHPGMAPDPGYHYPDHVGQGASRPTLGTPRVPSQPDPAGYAPQFEPFNPSYRGAAHEPAPPARQAVNGTHLGHAPYPHAGSEPTWPEPAPAPYAGDYGAADPAHTSQHPYPYNQAPDAGYASREPRIRSTYPAAEQEWSEPSAPHLRGPAYDQHPLAHPGAEDGYADPYAAPGAPAYYPAPAVPAEHDWNGSLQQRIAAQSAQDWGLPEPNWDPHAAAPPPDAYADPGYPGGVPTLSRDPAHEEYAAAQHGYAAHAPYAPPPSLAAEPPEIDFDQEDAAYDDDVEAGSGGRSGLVKIAAVLLGFIVIGGGLAYAYTSLFGSAPGDSDSKPPVVRNEASSPREKPQEPGGKKFANTDSKILGRLSDGSSAPTESASGSSTSSAGDSSSDSDSDGAPRKVTTMVIGRDGSIVSTSASPPPAALRPPPSVSAVPGLTIVDGFGGRPPPSVAPSVSPSVSAAARAAAPPQPSPQVRAPASKPIVIARAEPQDSKSDSTSAADASSGSADIAPAPPTTSKSRARTIKNAQAATSAGSASAAAGGSRRATSLGYVAVLASVPASSASRLEALKRFADLQQQYGAQLRDKTPDVQLADLAGKGKYHRLIVGPPGSRQQAQKLCSELKSAGYSSCWIKSY